VGALRQAQCKSPKGMASPKWGSHPSTLVRGRSISNNWNEYFIKMSDTKSRLQAVARIIVTDSKKLSSRFRFLSDRSEAKADIGREISQSFLLRDDKVI